MKIVVIGELGYFPGRFLPYKISQIAYIRAEMVFPIHAPVRGATIRDFGYGNPFKKVLFLKALGQPGHSRGFTLPVG